MKELVPIKVKIGLRPNGHADHPDWTKLQIVQDSGLGTAYKPDPMGGWKYDKTCGHKEESTDSPYGMQWGMLLVDPIFAQQAVETFPEIVTIMTEEEAETFWNSKACAHISENKSQADVLMALKAEHDLKVILGEDTIQLETKIRKAIDPNDPESGIKKNKNKFWKDAKKNFGVTIKK
jgi:hypothetical protein